MHLPRRLQILRGPIDVAPLVDVVLLLLIFFMLSSSFVLQPGIRVEPPRSLYGAGASSNRLIVTLLRQPGSDATLIFYNDRIMTLDELRNSLREAPSGLNAPPLILKSDKSIPLGLVVDVMNAAMARGLSVVIATQPTDGPNAP